MKLERQSGLEPLFLSVIANRFESVVRDMKSTLLRSARSTVINTARDFSCSVVTAGSELLAAAEGLPVHVIGSDLLARSMSEFHPSLAPGDAFLHNDPYHGNTHAADHTILAPVFHEGEHLFTVCAKAHQADIGNALPTTYSPGPADVYEEGALVFPCVQVQRAYCDIDDIIRMCRARIRVPDQWYGDYLAAIGAVRVGERAIQGLCAEYGSETLRAFVREWFDYSERRMAEALQELPEGAGEAETTHDPVPGLADGFTFRTRVTISRNPDRVQVNLRDNPDNYAGGMNSSEACSRAGAIAGVFNSIPDRVPLNAGSFRRVEVLLREGCMAGIPRFPHSCSVATTEPFDRIVAVVQRAFAEFGEGYGVAEGAMGQPPSRGVISGEDPRRDGAPYVNQIFMSSGGGPASAQADGWPTYTRACAAGALYHDSVELDEQRYPLHVQSRSLVPDSGGVGRFRGGLGVRTVYRAKLAPMTVGYMIDGHFNVPQGVRGGDHGAPADASRINGAGEEVALPKVGVVTIDTGDTITAQTNGGGGYGNPLERHPERVLEDVLEGWVTLEAARDRYGVVIEHDAVDEKATTATRAQRRQSIEEAVNPEERETQSR